jgi:uncharacterized membrane-anchored protein
MRNKNKKTGAAFESQLIMPKQVKERRKRSRSKDWLYRCVLALNLTAWILWIVSLIVFHYARPDFIAGVQVYWGIEGRDFWSQTYVEQLLWLLQGCLILSFVALILRAIRTRRQADRFGMNLLVLVSSSLVSLLILYISL